MLKFWSVPYICQVCKLYFYFGHGRDFEQYLYLSVFSKQWKCPPTFSFSYMLCSHFTQNCIFCPTWRLKILVLWQKIVENLLIFVYLVCYNDIENIDDTAISCTNTRSYTNVSGKTTSIQNNEMYFNERKWWMWESLLKWFVNSHVPYMNFRPWNYHAAWNVYLLHGVKKIRN